MISVTGFCLWFLGFFSLFSLFICFKFYAFAYRKLLPLPSRVNYPGRWSVGIDRKSFRLWYVNGKKTKGFLLNGYLFFLFQFFYLKYWCCDLWSPKASLRGNLEAVGVPTSVPVRVAHELLLAGHRYLDVRYLVLREILFWMHHLYLLLCL